MARYVSCYELLGVPEMASLQEIAGGFHSMSRRIHIQSLFGLRRAWKREKMWWVVDAFKTLVDDDERPKYDAFLASLRRDERRAQEAVAPAPVAESPVSESESTGRIVFHIVAMLLAFVFTVVDILMLVSYLATHQYPQWLVSLCGYSAPVLGIIDALLVGYFFKRKKTSASPVVTPDTSPRPTRFVLRMPRIAIPSQVIGGCLAFVCVATFAAWGIWGKSIVPKACMRNVVTRQVATVQKRAFMKEKLTQGWVVIPKTDSPRVCRDADE